MIVSEKDVSVALAYLNEDPPSISLAHKDLLDAETKTKTLEGELYLQAEGTIDEKWAQVWTFSRGRIVRWETFPDRASALAAAGLSEQDAQTDSS